MPISERTPACQVKARGSTAQTRIHKVNAPQTDEQAIEGISVALGEQNAGGMAVQPASASAIEEEQRRTRQLEGKENKALFKRVTWEIRGLSLRPKPDLLTRFVKGSSSQSKVKRSRCVYHCIDGQDVRIHQIGRIRRP